jgi:hypothetical protein
MSIGNLKDNGNKGNNYPWQLKMLLGMQCTCDELAAINANTDQVEFLLSAILTSLQEGNDYEAKFVVDTCDNNRVYLEVRIWDPTPAPGSWGPITYYVPGSSTPVTPVGEGTPGCLQYTDPTGILGQVLAELQLQTPILTDISTFTSRINVQGQTTMSASTPVVLPSDQSTLAIYPLPTTPVSGFTAAAITNTTPTDILVAPGAGIFTYVTHILVTNSHATVGTVVTILDDASASYYSGYAAPAGGGFSVSLPTPIKTNTSNRKIQAVCATTGSSVYVSIVGFTK